MNNWKPDTFSAEDLARKIELKLITVPMYQRGLVWKAKQKEMLIDTIKKGLPFGTILLYRDAQKNERIVDGLQRCYTIFEFMRNPARYFVEADIDDNSIQRIMGIMALAGNQSEIETKIKTCLLKWVETAHHTMKDVERMQYNGFVQELIKEFPSAKEKTCEIVDLIIPTLKSYQDVCSALANIIIPAIIIEGDEDVLPDVFERINSQGTKLTKYQIYAATWGEDRYSISNDLDDLLKKNRDRYDDMLGGMLELENYEPSEFLRESVLSVFEIAFGFGKVLSERYPTLFVGSNDASEVTSQGFTLLNACLGGRSIEMKSLNTMMRERLPDGSALTLFIKKLLSCVEYVEKLVGKFNKFKGNSQRSTKIQPLHTELQICSIIAYVFRGRHTQISYDSKGNITQYELDLNKINVKWSQEEKIFKDNVSKIYVSEIIQQRWMGSGDKKMDNILASMTYYTRAIPKTEFINTLRSWYESVKSERREYNRVATPNESEKLFLNIVYMNEFSANEHLDGSLYDIEHLATKNLMKRQLGRFDGSLRLPISSIGNLCLLPQSENRSKREKTIYGDDTYLKNSKYSLSELESRFSFTKKNDLDWLHDIMLTEELFQVRYIEFIDKRFETLLDRILENFDKI